ncbi:hypothetical protein GCM10010230_65960 [Streptomyces narbonensis]|nr:hypothetical protein GCM10010230_65960 [Streptomyces narbonensis]
MTTLEKAPTMPSHTGPATRPYTVTPLRTLVRRRIAWSLGRRPGPPGRADCRPPGHPSPGPSDPSVREEC